MKCTVELPRLEMFVTDMAVEMRLGSEARGAPCMWTLVRAIMVPPVMAVVFNHVSGITSCVLIGVDC